MYGPCTGPCMVVYGLYTYCTNGGVTAVYTWTRPCTKPCTRAVYTCTRTVRGRVQGQYTATDTARVHSRVHDLVDGRVLGRARGRVMAVYGGATAVCTYTRPIYKPYRICNFLTNSCCDYIRKEGKAPLLHHRLSHADAKWQTPAMAVVFKVMHSDAVRQLA